MKVTQKKLGDGKVQLDAVATVDEVNRALQQAQVGFAQQMGLRPEKDKTVAQVAEEKMGIKDLDSIVESQAVEALTGRECRIKWVNDVYLDGKKLCGILTEASGSFEEDALRYACVGIGVNVRTRAFPEGLCACSLWPQAVSRNRLAAEIAARLMAFAADLGAREFLYAYRRRSLVLGRTVAFTQGGVERRALAVDIGGNGELLVRYADGREEALNASEVRLLPPSGP